MEGVQGGAGVGVQPGGGPECGADGRSRGLRDPGSRENIGQLLAEGGAGGLESLRIGGGRRRRSRGGEGAGEGGGEDEEEEGKPGAELVSLLAGGYSRLMAAAACGEGGRGFPG